MMGRQLNPAAIRLAAKADMPASWRVRPNLRGPQNRAAATDTNKSFAIWRSKRSFRTELPLKIGNRLVLN
jgi:hypothetical protein